MFKINGAELEDLDFFDSEVLEKYENALDDVMSKSKNVTGEKSSEIIKKECQIVYEFFDKLWGEGTGQKVFKGKYNVMTSFKAFEEVNNKASEQKKELDSMLNKYSANRATRRSKGK
ncbi:DUF6673 family protein [Clostridium sp. 'White wine YQ']|uniref:DUF6673 family protein n=1 Tax=Clostridium sp. 'White wine YQ' TaxID=3027474 RepID=UPI0023650C07|nr:DUF6673 family protein [Clostridium sp. 'White wine YQ']MDD7793696.1 AP endonuclease [Clostridium sp. 'White wine YQ']